MGLRTLRELSLSSVRSIVVYPPSLQTLHLDQSRTIPFRLTLSVLASLSKRPPGENMSSPLPHPRTPFLSCYQKFLLSLSPDTN